MKKVFVTRTIPEAGIKMLKERFSVSIFSGTRPIDRETLLHKATESDALVSLLSDRIDAAVLQACDRLKIIANYAVGYNNIDVTAAMARGILVTNTPGVLTNATAEIAFALLIALTRRLPAADRFVREGKFTGWDPLLLRGDELKGKTIGILGMGRIGRDMARKCRCFGMKIIYHNRKPLAREEADSVSAVYCDLDQLLSESDAISIHTPLTEKTRHLIDEAAFAKMKDGVYLINTSRGAVVDEAALVRHLQSGKIRGAGLDVYEFEPQITPTLLEFSNVILLPHIGSATRETRDEMARMVARNVTAALEDKTPPNLVPELRV